MGKAKNLQNRVSSYFSPPTGELLPKTAVLVSEIAKIDHIVVESEVDALLLEANYIRKLQPKYNILGKDGKSFPLIEISIKDDLPLVRVVHQETDPKKIYFGPYPTGSDIRNLLRYLRRIFPFATQRHILNKRCFYSHIGLCPCQDLKNYKKNLKHFIDFLDGKRTNVQRQLEKEMLNNAKVQNFEKAKEVKDKLDQIQYITSGKNLPWAYEQNPNLVSDRIQEELNDLKRVLALKKLDKIECYDIANTSGKQATGAQIVFVNGEPEKKLYRHYKIKLNLPAGGQDDFAMLKEVISRRLKSDVPLPDLFVIDGGKGQLGAVLDLLSGQNVIGLAKKFETIITTSGQEINLPDSSPALHLLQRVRDEAHRFSRRYHFLLRSRKMLDLNK